MNNLSFAVIGAGAGGQSIAAVLAEKGCEVRISDKNPAVLNELRSAGRASRLPASSSSAASPLSLPKIQQRLSPVQMSS